MKLLSKILLGVMVILVAAVLSLALVLSHEAECQAPPELAQGAESMMAIHRRCYGPPDVVHLEKSAKPSPAEDEVLVQVHKAAVNPLDWHFMRGSPYIMRLQSGIGAPADSRLGVDFAGTVEAVGSSVTRFKPGDEVFGGGNGAFAEYLTIRENRSLAHKPANVSFAEAASVPIAAITALQALRDKGKLKSGQKVLINGASGGVGTFAVQIAKSMGAQVTGVCSTRNLELVRSLGADHVIDYTRQDYTLSAERYDLIIDNVGNHSLTTNRKVMKPGGTFVIVGGEKGDWLGPLLGPIKAMILSPFVDETFVTLMAYIRADDLEVLAGLMESGQLRAAVGQHYTLAEVPAALSHSEEGHARGKIIIDVR